MSIFKTIVNLSISFYLLICFYYNLVDSFLDLSAVNEEYMRHIFPPSGEPRNLIEERRLCHKRRYWATSCKQLFRKIREIDDDYRYSLYVNYPHFPDTNDGSKCEKHTLWFINTQDSIEEPQHNVEQMMIPCFNTEASVPSDTQNSNVVPDYSEFWIYPGSRTSWMLIRYYPEIRKFFLIYWLDDIEINDYVPSDIFSLPIPTSITDKNMLVEKLSAATQLWERWQLWASKSIMSTINADEITTLCVALVGQYLLEKHELLYPYLKLPRSNLKYFFNLSVHIEQQFEELYENYETKFTKGQLKVYVTQSNRNQWKQIGVVKGYSCPVISSPYIFYVALGTDENSLMLIRSRSDQANDEEQEEEIVKIIENVNKLHLRHLYFNGFV